VGDRVPTKGQVRALVDHGLTYREAADRLAIPAGQAYLIATGRPADAKVAEVPRSADRGLLGSRAQTLVNAREVSPTSRGDVHEWMRRRAYLDRSMRAGAEEAT
jgi:hypothetical protein